MGTWERAGSGQPGPPTQPRVSMNAHVRPEPLNQTTFHPPQPPPRTFGHVWRHFSLSQLGDGVLLVSSELEVRDVATEAPTTKNYPPCQQR